jgi:hypothetical protein
MKKVRVSQLSPGMVFSDHVYIDETSLLVPKGTPLRQRDLDELVRWKIREVYTDGVPVARPRPASALGHGAAPEPSISRVEPDGVPPDAEPEHRDRSTVSDLYRPLVSQLSILFERISRGADLDPSGLDRIRDAVFAIVRGSRERIIRFMLSGVQRDHGPAESALNTALISVLVGTEMKLTSVRLGELAVGALLHDVGMLLLPGTITGKRGGLTEEEHRRMRQHPLQSYRIITKALGYPDSVGKVALHHHERWDGDGYPAGLKEDAIDRLARIVAVADSFEAMISSRPYRSPMIGYTAMKTILSETSRRFDPQVLTVFIRTFGIYPIGSIVLLSDSRIARVERVHPDAPIRPLVRLLSPAGTKGGTDTGSPVDLRSEPHLFIVKAVDPAAGTPGRADR